MNVFDTHTIFESNNDYIFKGERIIFGIKDTICLEEKIYRSIYPSDKTWLDTAIYLKNLSDVTIDFNGATLYLTDDTIQPFVLDGCENITFSPKNLIII